jgi:hypothetical protein
MLTSKDLLYKALDYDGFWNTSKRMTSSKPSQARKLQLEKLLAAFGISKKNAKLQVPKKTSSGHYIQTIYFVSNRPKSMTRQEYIKTLTTFKYFSTGEFIADFDKVKYKDLIKRIISTTKRVFPEQLEIINKEPINLAHLFSNLYNFRLSVYHMFKFSFSTKMQEEFSIEEDYSLYLRKKFMESMNNNLSEVDKILCLLIDPAKRKFKEDEIAYPNYDFEILDKEWRNQLRK